MRLFLILLGGVALLALYLAFVGLRIDPRVVFQPQSHPPREGLALRGDRELADAFGVEVEHGRLGGLATTLYARPSGDRPLFVSCFGNASDRRNSGADYARKILPHGDVLIWDYPGYGDSAGAPGVEAVSEAVDRVLERAEGLAGERPLILWGHSLGGFVCAQMAARSGRVDALVLETTAPDVASVARAWRPRWLPLRVRFDPALAAFDTPDALTDFEGPVLVIGAGRDQVLPVGLSRQLAERLPEARYLELPRATHYSAGFDPQAQQAVAEMIEALPPG